MNSDTSYSTSPAKCRTVKTWSSLQPLMPRMRHAELPWHWWICRQKLAGLEETLQHAVGVVVKLDGWQCDTLERNYLSLRLEHCKQKELVQLLVCKIDAQLFERVVAEVFETKDVQKIKVDVLAGAIPRCRGLIPSLLPGAQRGVHALDDPCEAERIDGLEEPLQGFLRLLRPQIDAHTLAPDQHRTVG
eukprot:7303987-Prymnesium_polylepis.1